MIYQKLKLLFAKLTQEELNCIERSGIAVQCDIEPSIISKICEKVKLKVIYNSNYQ